MGSSAATITPQIDPSTGERIQFNPETGERMSALNVPRATSTLAPTANFTPDVAADGFKAAVNSKMVGTSPSYAYQNRDELDKQLRDRVGDYDGELDPTIMNDIKSGWENSIFGLSKRGKLPEQVRDPGIIDKFATGLTQMVADVPYMLVGGAAGGAAGSEVPVVGTAIGAAAGALALPAAARSALVTGIKNGKVTSFSDLLHRAADVTWEATKGAATGVATELAGGLPVGSVIAKSGATSIAMKGLYQAAALTTTADLLEGRLPNAGDFAGNAALIVPLNLITHGTALRTPETKQALMDVYAENGTTPEESTSKLTAQPPVKPEPAPGLRAAIKTEEGFVEADTDEHHADLAQRRIGQKPVTLEELEAEPELADKVLQNPTIYDQPEIDRAWTLKKDAIDSGDAKPEDAEASQGPPATIEELYNRGELKSGRGFSTPDGKFLERGAAKKWVKDNEPEVYDKWKEIAGSDKSTFHSEDYAEARDRVNAANLAKGEPALDPVAPDNVARLAAARSGLNKVKADLAGSGSYMKEVLRTLFVGQRDTRIAATTQLRDGLKKLIPDYRDQEALTFMRDFKDSPVALQLEIDKARAGDNEKLKALIPSMERAQHPSPQLVESDQRMTQYFSGALSELQSLGLIEKGIAPDRYITHILQRVSEKGETEGRLGPFTGPRTYETVVDALKTGHVEARTVNALDALSIYGDRYGKLVAAKLTATELKNTQLGIQGTPESHPIGWVEMAPMRRALAGLYVPKDIADAMKPIFESSGKAPELDKLRLTQGYIKSLELGLSVFHMKALSITAANNMSFADFSRSLVSDTKSPEFAAAERGWAADGLVTSKTGTPYEAYKGLNKSSIPTGMDKFANAPVIKQIDSLSKELTHQTFDVVQRKFKVMDASLKIASWMAKNPEASSEELFAARRSIAKQVNSAYGGLNWDVMGRSKAFREVSRTILLAPDWTYSNIASLKYALGGGPAGSAARAFWVKSFLTGMAASQATSIFLTGHLSDRWTQVHTGHDKDGRELYSNWFFAGAPKDAITWVDQIAHNGGVIGLANSIINKLSPVAGTLVALHENKDRNFKPIIKPEESAVEKTARGAAFVAEKALPFTVTTIAGMLTDGEHHSMLDYAAALAGSTSMEDSGGTAAAPKSVLPGGGKSKGFHLPGVKRQ